MSTAVWNRPAGGAWNIASNWVGDKVPTAGQDVSFPNNGSSPGLIVLRDAVTVGSISLGGNYSFSGQARSTITVNGDISANNTSELGPNQYISIGVPVVLGHDTTVTVDHGDSLTLSGNVSDGGSAYGITKKGEGLLDFETATSYTGPTIVADGTAQVDAKNQSSFTIDPKGTLTGGHGANVGGITGNGGILYPAESGQSPSYMDVNGNVSLGAGTTFKYGYNPGDDSELSVFDSSVNLTGSNLDISSRFPLSVGETLTVIDNHTDHAVTGTFNGLPQGAVKNVDGVNYQISYDGGSSGKNVTLTAVNAPPVPTIAFYTPTTSTSSDQVKLNILGFDPDTQNDSDLTYTWSVPEAPSGAQPVKFSENGTNAAKGATARFSKAGTYRLLCTITNSDGEATTQEVSVTVQQVKTLLRLTPHGQKIAAGATQQFSGILLDQFNHRIPATSISYAVLSGGGTISTSGLFTAGTKPGRVVLQVTIDGLTGTLATKIV